MTPAERQALEQQLMQLSSEDLLSLVAFIAGWLHGQRFRGGIITAEVTLRADVESLRLRYPTALVPKPLEGV